MAANLLLAEAIESRSEQKLSLSLHSLRLSPHQSKVFLQNIHSRQIYISAQLIWKKKLSMNVWLLFGLIQQNNCQ